MWANLKAMSIVQGGSTLTQQLGIPFVDLTRYEVEPSVLKLVPAAVANPTVRPARKPAAKPAARPAEKTESHESEHESEDHED